MNSEYFPIRSPIKFLKTRIAESMEKYGTFSGLKGFEILNMYCNSQPIAKVLDI
jgi:hypothetical protein